MHIVIIALIVVVSILLIGIVLIQKSKGGGLSSQFGGAGNVMGGRQTNSFPEKGTWVLVSLLVVLSIVSVWTAPRVNNASELRAVPQAPAAAAPALPAPGQMDVVPVTVPETEATVVEAEEVETPAQQ